LRRRFTLLFSALALFAAGCGAQATGWAGPVVVENSLYVGTTQGKLIALDLATQSTRWEYPLEKDKRLNGLYSTPYVRAGTVYVGTYDGHVHAVDAGNGVTRWDRKPDGAVVGELTASENSVYVGAAEGLLALDATTGLTKWRFNGGEGGGTGFWSAPAVDGDTIYVGSPDRRIYAVRDDGDRATERWRLLVGGAIVATPRVTGGTLYVGALDSKFYAVDASTGQKKWEFAGGNWFWATAVVSGGTVYAGCLDSKVYALDAATGDKKWEASARDIGPAVRPGYIRGAPALARATLVVGDSERNIYGLDPETGKLQWNTTADGPVLAPLSAAGTTAYAVSTQNTLYALDAAKNGTKLWEKRLVQ
jgi:serine/threonine-protein kinase